MVQLAQEINMLEMGKRAKEAAFQLAAFSTQEKNQALLTIADALEANTESILAANKIDIEMAHDIALVGLLAAAGGRTGSHKTVFPGLQPGNHRTAVVNHAALEQGFDRLINLQVISGWLAGLLDERLGHPLVYVISAGYHYTREKHGFAYLEAADGFIVDG